MGGLTILSLLLSVFVSPLLTPKESGTEEGAGAGALPTGAPNVKPLEVDLDGGAPNVKLGFDFSGPTLVEGGGVDVDDCLSASHARHLLVLSGFGQVHFW